MASKRGREVDPSMELAKLRKTMSNRLSAQRCRNKKAQYIKDMEKKVNDLQASISFLAPEIENHKQMQNVLMVQKSLLQQKLDNFTHKSTLLNGEIEEMQAEVKRLRELHEAQRQQKFDVVEMEYELGTKHDNYWAIEQYLDLELWGN